MTPPATNDRSLNLHLALERLNNEEITVTLGLENAQLRQPEVLGLSLQRYPLKGVAVSPAGERSSHVHGG